MMIDQDKKTEIGKYSLRYGIIIGVISIVISLVLILIDPLMIYTNLWVQFLPFLLVVILLTVFGIEVRTNVGGYWNFGQAYQSLIIMALFISLLGVVFNFIHLRFVDQEMPGKIADAVAQVTTERLEKMKLSQEQIDEITKQFESGEFREKFEPTFKNQFSNFGFALLIYAIVNIIIAACIKRQPPLVSANLADSQDPTL